MLSLLFVVKYFLVFKSYSVISVDFFPIIKAYFICTIVLFLTIKVC